MRIVLGRLQMHPDWASLLKQIVETEISANVSSEFASNRVNQELVAAEEMILCDLDEMKNMIYSWQLAQQY